MPASQAAGAGWPFGAGGAGMPHITISTTRTLTQAPGEFRRPLLIALIFVVGIFLVAGGIMTPIVASLFDSSGDVEEVGVGATARVQSFEATVRSIDCTKQAITKPDDPATSYDDSSTEAAKGKFCVVSFSVKNVGEKTESYPTSSIEATNPTERVLDRNIFAERYANNESEGLSDPIDPGKTVDHLLVFDVPTDTTLAYLRISDDLFADSTIKVKFGS